MSRYIGLFTCRPWYYWDDEEDPMAQSDAEYDEFMDKYMKDNPNEFEKEFGSLEKPSEANNQTINTNDLPFWIKD